MQHKKLIIKRNCVWSYEGVWKLLRNTKWRILVKIGRTLKKPQQINEQSYMYIKKINKYLV